VIDANGSEWQVVNNRKTMIAEESDDDSLKVNSDSDDEIAFA